MSLPNMPPVHTLAGRVGHRLRGVRLAVAMASFLVVGVMVGIAVPAMPEVQIKYFRQHTQCHSRGGDGACANQASTAASAAESVSSMGSLLLASFYGTYSDRHGRRPVYFAALVAAVLPFLAMQTWTSNLWLYYVLKALAGFAPTASAVVFSVVADLAPPTSRLESFGLCGACFYGCFSTGAGLAAVLLPYFDSEGLLRASVGVMSCFAVISIMALPETLPEDNEGEKEASDLGRTKSLVSLLVCQASGGMDHLLRATAIVGVLSLLPETGVRTISLFYAEAKLQLTGEEMASLGARMLCIVGLGGFLWQTVGLAIMRRACPSMAWAYEVALLANLLHLMGYAVMWAPWVFLANAALAGGALVQPVILRSIVSQAMPANMQGQASGLMSGVESACSVAGPAIFGGLFYVGGQLGIQWFPFAVGMSLVVASGLLTASKLAPSASFVGPESSKPLLPA